MTVDARMFAKAFSVVGGDGHPRSIEDLATPSSSNSRPICSSRSATQSSTRCVRMPRPRRDSGLVDWPPALDHVGLAVSFVRHRSDGCFRSAVRKGYEYHSNSRTRRTADPTGTPFQPIRNSRLTSAASLRRVDEQPEAAACWSQQVDMEPILEASLNRLQPLDRSIRQRRRLQGGHLEKLIFVNAETPFEAGVGRNTRNCHESGRRVSPRTRSSATWDMFYPAD